MDFQRKHIETIIQANNDHRLAIFVGSGISKSCETKTRSIPTWSELIDDLQEDLNNIDESDFLKIAQLYFLEFEESLVAAPDSPPHSNKEVIIRIFHTVYNTSTIYCYYTLKIALHIVYLTFKYDPSNTLLQDKARQAHRVSLSKENKKFSRLN